jgi:hypothetical protein
VRRGKLALDRGTEGAIHLLEPCAWPFADELVAGLWLIFVATHR